MNFLLLNQCFYPDVAATGQYLTDLALELVGRGHKVTVISGDRGYDDGAHRFKRRETWRGIDIIRIRSISIGKTSRFRRALNFGSFMINCALQLIFLQRFDVVVALTSPPLISLLASCFVRLKGGRLFAWVMDLNPDEAIAAGWLKESSLVAQILEFCLRSSLRRAERIIVLDRFVRDRLVRKAIPENRISVIPPWALDNSVHYDEDARNAFRSQHGLADSFVVMHAGNHSPCHPLETLLDAAQKLADRPDLIFCFIGGGSEQEKVKAFAAARELKNIKCLPYVPLKEVSGALSAGDLHVVVMGEQFTGIVHPCKIYNILAIGSPFLYIGPKESHITDIVNGSVNEGKVIAARHGDVEGVAAGIVEMAAASGNTQTHDVSPSMFSRTTLLPRLINLFESNVETTANELPVVVSAPQSTEQ